MAEKFHLDLVPDIFAISLDQSQLEDGIGNDLDGWIQRNLIGPDEKYNWSPINYSDADARGLVGIGNDLDGRI